MWAGAICGVLPASAFETKTAQTAEQLMRSRYSAFALQQIDYIWKPRLWGSKAF